MAKLWPLLVLAVVVLGDQKDASRKADARLPEPGTTPPGQQPPPGEVPGELPPGSLPCQPSDGLIFWRHPEGDCSISVEDRAQVLALIERVAKAEFFYGKPALDQKDLTFRWWQATEHACPECASLGFRHIREGGVNYTPDVFAERWFRELQPGVSTS